MSTILINTHVTGTWNRNNYGNSQKQGISKWNSPNQASDSTNNCRSVVYEANPRKNNCKLRYKCKRECKKVNKQDCTTKPKLDCKTYKKKKCENIQQTICPGRRVKREAAEERQGRTFGKIFEAKKKFLKAIFSGFAQSNSNYRPQSPANSNYPSNNYPSTSYPSSSYPSSNYPSSSYPSSSYPSSNYPSSSYPSSNYPTSNNPSSNFPSSNYPSQSVQSDDNAVQDSNCKTKTKRVCTWVPYREVCTSKPETTCTTKPTTECKKKCKNTWVCDECNEVTTTQRPKPTQKPKPTKRPKTPCGYLGYMD